MDLESVPLRGRTVVLPLAWRRLCALLAATVMLSLAAAPAFASSNRHLAHPARRAFGRRQVTLATAATPRAHTNLRTRPTASARRRCVGAHIRLGHARSPRIRRAVVCLLDRERRAHRLPRLVGNRRLNRSAQHWTNLMVRDQLFSHGSDFAARISAAGFGWSHVGENIATGYRTPAAVVRAWMRSTGHCQNILSPAFREVGTGLDRSAAKGGRPGTWTLDFGLLMRQRLPSNNWGPAEGCPYKG